MVIILRNRSLLANLASPAATAGSAEDSGQGAVGDVRPAQTFIVAGQSNAVGRAFTAPPNPFPLEDGRIVYAMNAAQGTVRFANDPLSSNSDTRRSPWPFFSQERLRRNRPTPFIIQTAQGATCLHYPREEGEPLWDPDTGSLYSRLLERAALSQEIGFPPPVAVLWHQGECESDASDSATVIQASYRDALLNLADHIWTDLRIPTIAALISVVNAKDTAVREGILEAVELRPYLFLGPETNDIELQPDGVHVEDVVTLGRRWSDSVDRAGLKG